MSYIASIQCNVYSAVSKQIEQTLSSEIVQESDSSDATYNSAYVSDEQNLFAKTEKYLVTIIRLNLFVTR